MNCSVLISLSSSKRKLSYFNSKYFNFNIFNPESADPEVHAERVFQIFKSGAKYEDIEYSPQMERVFVETLKRVCKDPAKRNWEAFRKELKDYADEVVSNTGDYTYKNSRTAVENRIRRYSLGTLKHCFDIKTGLDIRKLFNHNVLLDVSGVLKLGGEKEDALFFLNMLLKYLYDENIERGSRNYKGIRHVTIIEDEQYFASAQTSKKSTISSYIEDIALLLRGTGECLISLATRPAVSAEILANCGIFISFRENMQRIMNLELAEYAWEKSIYYCIAYSSFLGFVGVIMGLRFMIMYANKTHTTSFKLFIMGLIDCIFCGFTTFMPLFM